MFSDYWGTFSWCFWMGPIRTPNSRMSYSLSLIYISSSGKWDQNKLSSTFQMQVPLHFFSCVAWYMSLVQAGRQFESLLEWHTYTCTETHTNSIIFFNHTLKFGVNNSEACFYILIYMYVFQEAFSIILSDFKFVYTVLYCMYLSATCLFCPMLYMKIYSYCYL